MLTWRGLLDRIWVVLYLTCFELSIHWCDQFIIRQGSYPKPLSEHHQSCSEDGLDQKPYPEIGANQVIQAVKASITEGELSAMTPVAHFGDTSFIKIGFLRPLLLTQSIQDLQAAVNLVWQSCSMDIQPWHATPHIMNSMSHGWTLRDSAWPAHYNTFLLLLWQHSAIWACRHSTWHTSLCHCRQLKCLACTARSAHVVESDSWSLAPGWWPDTDSVSTIWVKCYEVWGHESVTGLQVSYYRTWAGLTIGASRILTREF